MRARRVAVCTGGYTGQALNPLLKNKIMPILSNSVVTRPLTDAELQATNFKSLTFLTDTRTLRFYYRLLKGNRLQIGSRSSVSGADAEDPVHLKLLTDAIARKFPPLAGIQIDYSWWGWVDVSHDMMPRITQPEADKKIWYAVGYGGNGVSFSTWAGKRLAERMAGKDAGRKVFELPIYKSPLPFPNVLGAGRVAGLRALSPHGPARALQVVLAARREVAHRRCAHAGERALRWCAPGQTRDFWPFNWPRRGSSPQRGMRISSTSRPTTAAHLCRTSRGSAMPLLPFSRRAAMLTAALAAASAWLAPAVHAQEPKRGGTLVLGSTQTPRHLNGAVQSGIATAMPSTQIFASPLRFDDKWNPQPYLAESWKLAEDGKSLTLNLRKNAVFHDGKPVTSADVAFSIMAIKANHPFTTMMGRWRRSIRPMPYTAIIRMSTPHPAIVLAMSPALCPILPKHIYGDGQDLKTHPRNSTDVVGSGPFTLIGVQGRPAHRAGALRQVLPLRQALSRQGDRQHHARHGRA